jgi:hypothetical protein
VTKKQDGQRCNREGCKNFAVSPSAGCRNHGPEFAQQRAMWGKRRHPRFATAAAPDGKTFDKARIPTVPAIIDKLLEIEQGIADGTIDAKDATPRIQALKGAREALHIERWSQEKKQEREDKKRFAWEEANRDRPPEAEAESAEEKPSILPPWMRPTQ